VNVNWGLTTARRLHQRLTAIAVNQSAAAAGAGALSTPKVAFYGFPDLDHELDQRELSVLLAWLRKGGTAYPDVGPHLGGVVRVELGPAAPVMGVDVAIAVVEDTAGQGGSRSATATFRVPEADVPALLAHPVAVRGGHFSLVRGAEPGTVTTTFVSPRPQEVAEAIRERVRARLLGPEGGKQGAEGVCPTS
jgi:hypothetical protein